MFLCVTTERKMGVFVAEGNAIFLLLLEMLIFEEMVKSEIPEKKLPEGYCMGPAVSDGHPFSYQSHPTCLNSSQQMWAGLSTFGGSPYSQAVTSYLEDSTCMLLQCMCYLQDSYTACE